MVRPRRPTADRNCATTQCEKSTPPLRRRPPPCPRPLARLSGPQTMFNVLRAWGAEQENVSLPTYYRRENSCGVVSLAC